MAGKELMQCIGAAIYGVASGFRSEIKVHGVLFMIALVGAAILLASCQTTEQRISAAAKTEGEARAVIPFPDPPASCIAKIGRVRIGDEPWVVTFRRWEVVADIRDQQAADCAAWFADIKERWGK